MPRSREPRPCTAETTTSLPRTTASRVAGSRTSARTTSSTRSTSAGGTTPLREAMRTGSPDDRRSGTRAAPSRPVPPDDSDHRRRRHRGPDGGIRVDGGVVDRLDEEPAGDDQVVADAEAPSRRPARAVHRPGAFRSSPSRARRPSRAGRRWRANRRGRARCRRGRAQRRRSSPSCGGPVPCRRSRAGVGGVGQDVVVAEAGDEGLEVMGVGRRDEAVGDVERGGGRGVVHGAHQNSDTVRCNERSVRRGNDRRQGPALRRLGPAAGLGASGAGWSSRRRAGSSSSAASPERRWRRWRRRRGCRSRRSTRPSGGRRGWCVPCGRRPSRGSVPCRPRCARMRSRPPRTTRGRSSRRGPTSPPRWGSGRRRCSPSCEPRRRWTPRPRPCSPRSTPGGWPG